MKPTVKTALIIGGSIVSVFVVPVILIIFSDYLYFTIFISTFLSSIYLVAHHGYEDLLVYVRRHDIEEERVFHSFGGDPEKIRFYRGFKKYFDGDVNAKQLQQWFENHPRK